MPTAAVATHGAQLLYESLTTPGTYIKIAETKDFTLSRTNRTEEVTNHDSQGGAEHVFTGVQDGGTVSFSANFLSAASHNDMRTVLGSGATRNYRVVPPNGTKRYEFSAIVTELSEPFPVSGARVVNMSLLVSGKIVEANIA